jgi:AraC family transcriptional regulator
VTAIAYEVGFEDLSNFTRAFRTEFGMNPRAWRTRRGGEARRSRLRGIAGKNAL